MQRRYIVQDRRGVRINGEPFAPGEVVPVALFENYAGYDSDMTSLLNRDQVIAVPASMVEELPEDIPAREKLLAAGYSSLDAVEAADDLTEVTGIGEATAAEIAEYLSGDEGDEEHEQPEVEGSPEDTEVEGNEPEEGGEEEPEEDDEEAEGEQAEGEGDDERAAEQTLPEDFPGRKPLTDAGLDTVGAVAEVDDLTELPGIGEATEEDIQDALAEMEG